MTGIRMGATIFGAVVLLAGCDFVDDALIPTLTGEDPAGNSAAQEQAKPAEQKRAATPAAAASTQTQTASRPRAASGTPVAQRVAGLRNDADSLKGSVDTQNSDYQRLRQSSGEQITTYQALVSDTQTKLQLGTTAGNPQLVRSLNDAQTALEQLSVNTEQMDELTARVADDRSMAQFILQSVDATFELSGAVEQDHAQLKDIEDDTKRTQVLIDRLSRELATDIPRQTNFVARGRAELTALNVAVSDGKLPDAGTAAAATSAASAPTPTVASANRRPFVVIRFDRDDVAYEEPLFNAVQQALDRRPSAVFDLVSVVPQQGSSEVAERNAERVMRSLTEMGLPSERITLSALSSNEASSNEVQVFVR